MFPHILYLKDLKLLSFEIPTLKSAALPFEKKNIKSLLSQNNLNYIILDYTVTILHVNFQHHLFFVHQFL